MSRFQNPNHATKTSMLRLSVRDLKLPASKAFDRLNKKGWRDPNNRELTSDNVTIVDENKVILK